MLIGDKEISKEEVTTITRFGRVVTDFEVHTQLKARKDIPSQKISVTEKETLDFLKRLKRSEYKIIEQLDKMSD